MAFTYFFRDRQPLEMAINYLLPSIVEMPRVSIWSAGSAMGPEPYSIAILLRERLLHDHFQKIKIIATDIDMSNYFGQIIASGRYKSSDLQRLPPGFYDRYFVIDDENPEYSKISEEIRSSVEFYRHDLLSYRPIDTDFNLIVCKNVLLHFSDEERENVVTMFHQALADDGILLLEHTQSLPENNEPLFEQVFTNGRIYKKRNEN